MGGNSLDFLDSWITGPNPGGTSGRFALERRRVVLIVEGNGMVVCLNNQSYSDYWIVAQISKQCLDNSNNGNIGLIIAIIITYEYWYYNSNY